MKIRRRIEITTYRRRTTVVLREHRGGNIAAPPHQADVPYTLTADAPMTEGVEPAETLTRLPPASLPLYVKCRSKNEEGAPGVLRARTESYEEAKP